MSEERLAAAARDLEAKLPKAANPIGQVILAVPMIAGAVVGILLAMRDGREGRSSKLIIIAGILGGFAIGVAMFHLFKRARRSALVPEIARRHGVSEEALRRELP